MSSDLRMGQAPPLEEEPQLGPRSYSFQRPLYSQVWDGTRCNLKTFAAVVGSAHHPDPGLASLNPGSSFHLCLSWLSLWSQHCPALACRGVWSPFEGLEHPWEPLLGPAAPVPTRTNTWVPASD